MGVQDEDTAPARTDFPVFCYEFEYAFSMQLRYNYRLDPWPQHRIAFGKAFGCARVVFNDAGLAVTAWRARVRPSPCGMARREEAGTHPKSHPEAAGQAGNPHPPGGGEG